MILGILQQFSGAVDFKMKTRVTDNSGCFLGGNRVVQGWQGKSH